MRNVNARIEKLLPLTIRRLLFVLMAGGLMGCGASTALLGGSTGGGASLAATASQISIPSGSMFTFVGRSIKLHYADPASLLADSSRVEAELIEEKCTFHRPDPPFLVPSLSSQRGWLFAGRLNQNSLFQALEYKSIFTLGLTGTQQLNTWPVSMVSLGDFGDTYLSDRLQLISQAKLSPEEDENLLGVYTANADKITSITMHLIRSYNPQTQCLPAAHHLL